MLRSGNEEYSYALLAEFLTEDAIIVTDKEPGMSRVYIAIVHLSEEGLSYKRIAGEQIESETSRRRCRRKVQGFR